MEVNILQTKSKRKCPDTCKGVIVDATKGRYCDCIEKKLPKLNNPHKSVGTSYYQDITNLQLPAEFTEEDYTDLGSLEGKLLKAGLSPYEIRLLIAKYVDGRSLRDIFKEGNWTSIGSLNHQLRSATKKLRQGGFGI